MGAWRAYSVDDANYMMQSMQHVAAHNEFDTVAFAVADAAARPHRVLSTSLVRIEEDVKVALATTMSIAAAFMSSWARPRRDGTSVLKRGCGELPADSRRVELLAHDRLVQEIMAHGRNGLLRGSFKYLKPAAVLLHNSLKSSSDMLKQEAKHVRPSIMGRTPVEQVFVELLAIGATSSTRAWRAYDAVQRAERSGADLDGCTRAQLQDRLNASGDTTTLVLKACRQRAVLRGLIPLTRSPAARAVGEVLPGALTAEQALAVALGNLDLSVDQLAVAAAAVPRNHPRHPAFWAAARQLTNLVARSTNQRQLYFGEAHPELTALRLSGRAVYLQHVTVRYEGKESRCILDCQDSNNRLEREGPAVRVLVPPVQRGAEEPRDYFGGRSAFDVFHQTMTASELPEHPYTARSSPPALTAHLTQSMKKGRSDQKDALRAVRAQAAADPPKLRWGGDE